jgi:hypothetical protein
VQVTESDTVRSPALSSLNCPFFRPTSFPSSHLANAPRNGTQVGDLKQLLWSLTTVPPDRQKLVGLVKGKLPGDEEEVIKLGLGDGTSGKSTQFMMMCVLCSPFLVEKLPN